MTSVIICYMFITNIVVYTLSFGRVLSRMKLYIYSFAIVQFRRVLIHTLSKE